MGARGWIRQAVILPRLEGELVLKKGPFPGHQPALTRGCDGLTDRGFVVMPPLIGRIDASKALSQGELGQALVSCCLHAVRTRNGVHEFHQSTVRSCIGYSGFMETRSS